MKLPQSNNSRQTTNNNNSLQSTNYQHQPSGTINLSRKYTTGLNLTYKNNNKLNLTSNNDNKLNFNHPVKQLVWSLTPPKLPHKFKLNKPKILKYFFYKITHSKPK
jgi:hypothetical protein